MNRKETLPYDRSEVERLLNMLDSTLNIISMYLKESIPVEQAVARQRGNLFSIFDLLDKYTQNEFSNTLFKIRPTDTANESERVARFGEAVRTYSIEIVEDALDTLLGGNTVDFKEVARQLIYVLAWLKPEETILPYLIELAAERKVFLLDFLLRFYDKGHDVSFIELSRRAKEAEGWNQERSMPLSFALDDILASEHLTNLALSRMLTYNPDRFDEHWQKIHQLFPRYNYGETYSTHGVY